MTPREELEQLRKQQGELSPRQELELLRKKQGPISGLMKEALGPVDYAAHLASSMVAKPVGEIAGLSAAAFGEPGDVAGFQKDVQDRLTWSPKTRTGQFLTESNLNPLNLLGKAVSGASEFAGDMVGGEQAGDTPRGASGNIFREGIPQALGFLGVKKAPAIASGVQKAADVALWPATAGGRGVRNTFGPYMGQGGLDAATGRIGNLAAGDKAANVIAELQRQQSQVPGVNWHAGQAAVPAGSTEFSALQRLASDANPSLYSVAGGIDGAQIAARRSDIQTIGQTPAALDAAINARSVAAKANYGAASKQLIASDAALEQLMQRPSMEKVLARAKSLAQEEGRQFQIGQNVPEQTVPSRILNANGQPASMTTIPAQVAKYPVESLHYMKMAMDDLIKNPERFGIGAAEAKAIGGTQGSFVTWMGQKSKAYDLARTEYAKASKPIDQMKIGQALEAKLVAPLEVKERPAAFAQAARDEAGTMKRATGQPRYRGYDDALTPSQNAIVDAVGSDLSRTATFETMASEGMKSARDRVMPAVPDVPPTGFFSPIISASRGAVNRLEGKTTAKIMQNLSEVMADPVRMARLMREATPQQRKLIEQLLKKTNAIQAMGLAMPVASQNALAEQAP